MIRQISLLLTIIFLDHVTLYMYPGPKFNLPVVNDVIYLVSLRLFEKRINCLLLFYFSNKLMLTRKLVARNTNLITEANKQKRNQKHLIFLEESDGGKTN